MEKLTDQEEEIMLRIWRLGRCAVKQIMELLPEPRPPYTTVASIVNNYFKNSFKEMVSFFAKDEKISPEDLKDIIREIENSEE